MMRQDRPALARAFGGLYTRMMVTGAPSPAEALDSPRISVVQTGQGESAAWSAEVVGLPECSATGATPEEAVRRAWAALEGWRVRVVEDESGPRDDQTRHSGRLLIRMPATLHDALAQTAKDEGVSLNQFITSALASAVEWRSRRPASSPPREEQPSGRSLRIALAANLAAVTIAALVAIVLLVAWGAG
jgi:antitoxin HicB